MDLTKPLNPETAEGRAFVAGIQGNIVKGHGRLYGALLFVRVNALPEISCPLVRELAALCVTPASEQARQSSQRKAKLSAGAPADSGPFGSILVSSRGFEALGLQAEFRSVKLGSSPELGEAKTALAFRDGLRRRITYSGDGWNPGLKHWCGNYLGDDFHLLVLLADDDPLRLNDSDAAARRLIERFGVVTHEEAGKRLVHPALDPEKPIEHFGFRDSISGPVFVDREFQPGEWPRQASPLGDLFVEEKITGNHLAKPSGLPSYGSFVSFLKMEQNVAEFREKAEKLGVALGIAAGQAEALAVGRQKDGSPLVPVTGPNQNAFTYEGSGGEVCPFHAHTRRMERRGLDRPAPMARRSFVYGPQRDDLFNGGAVPKTGCGLLFFGYQSNLLTFETRMRHSASGNGVDALIGRKIDDIGGAALTDRSRDGRQQWRQPDGSVVVAPMYDFVTPKGGEYFFCPSLEFFRRMGNPPAPPQKPVI